MPKTPTPASSPASTTRSTARQAVGDLGPGSVHSVFQPIVDLHDATVVGFEALGRGPRGPLESPEVMLAEARTAGLTAQLDTLLRDTALRHAAAAGISAPLTLFVNADPAALDAITLADFPACPDGVLGVVEITERALASHPALLMQAVDRLRDLGWGLALDDVGSEPAVAAMMPLVEPDVVKLDMRVVQGQPDRSLVELVAAVRAHAEHTRCLIVAEGIETADHYAAALALGADLGQGHLLGEPSRLPESPDVPGAIRLRERARASGPERSAFAGVDADRPPRRATVDLMLQLSRHLEREAQILGSTGVLLASFEHARHFTPDTRRRYGVLARRLGLVGVVAEGLQPLAGAELHTAPVTSDDPLSREWAVVVLGPHYAAALLSREVFEDLGMPDAPREFEYHLTFERDAVVAAARVLMCHLV